MNREGLHECGPMLAAFAANVDATNALIVELKTQLAVVKAERDEALAKVRAVVDAHNQALAELHSLRSTVGVLT